MPSRPDPLRGALPGFAFDLRMGNGAGRYRHILPDGRLGRLVARDEIVGLLRTVSDASGERFAALARAAVEGRISPAEFFRTTQSELRALYNSTSALAAGGWNRMTPQLHGANGRILGLGTREYPVGEYTSLRNFAQDIADGKLTPAQAEARARLYSGKAYSRFWSVETQRLADAGYTEERWVDTKLPNECGDCPELAARGWVPIGTLPDPGDGATECLGNCRCSKIQRTPAGVVAKASQLGIDFLLNMPYNGNVVSKEGVTMGGPGSGNFGHVGRPGLVGGAGPVAKMAVNQPRVPAGSERGGEWTGGVSATTLAGGNGGDGDLPERYHGDGGTATVEQAIRIMEDRFYGAQPYQIEADLQRLGITSVLGYHVSSVADQKGIREGGIKLSHQANRNVGAYFFLSRRDAISSADNLGHHGDYVITTIKIPFREASTIEDDSLYNGTFEFSTSAARIRQAIPKEWIVAQQKMRKG